MGKDKNKGGKDEEGWEGRMHREGDVHTICGHFESHTCIYLIL